MTLDEAWKKIERAGGPASVLIDRNGEQLISAIAKKQGRQWDVLYIRSDGWSLGCEFYLAQYAEELHREEWIGFMRRGEKVPVARTFLLT
jgi:hypothetical protein